MNKLVVMDFHLVVMRYSMKISTDTVIRNVISPPIHHNVQSMKKCLSILNLIFLDSS